MFKFSLVTDVLKGLKYIHGSPFKYHGSLRSSSCVVDGRYVTALYNVYYISRMRVLSYEV